METPSHILIARLSSIGDIILTTPVIRAVRKAYPDASISFLVKKEFASLVENNPHLDRVITFDKSGGVAELKRLRRHLKQESFDWFIDLHNNLRTNYLKLALGVPLVSTYHKQTLRRNLLVWFGTNFFRQATPVYLRYFEATRKGQIKYDDQGTEVYFSSEVTDHVKKTLESSGIGADTSFAVLCPGASFKNKQWLPERFSEVADRLISEGGLKVVLLGGKADQEVCDLILRGMKNTAVSLAGKFPLPASAALLSCASLVITNDSGMMHLAQSQKRPVVAIFGPTTREMGFFPIPHKSIVVEKPVRCRPCTTKGLNKCPEKHFRCMKTIETSDVFDAAAQLLSPPIGKAD